MSTVETQTIVDAAKAVVAFGPSNRSGDKYAAKTAALDALDDALEAWEAETTVPVDLLIDAQNALLHRVMRNHKFTTGCDGCLNLRAVMRGLLGLPDLGAA